MIKDMVRGVVALGLALVLPVGLAVAGSHMASASERGGTGAGVSRTRTATVNVGDMPTSDCWWEVGLSDDDGRPGGAKSVRSELKCP